MRFKLVLVTINHDLLYAMDTFSLNEAVNINVRLDTMYQL